MFPPRAVLSILLAVLVVPATAQAAWHQPVGGPSPINNDPARSAFQPSIAIVSGVPHVAWVEADGVTDKLRVSRLNAAGTAWEQVVGGPNPINPLPTRGAAAPSLASIAGVPYVAWVDYQPFGSDQKIRVSRLNAAGTAWEQVVGGANPINNDPNQLVGGPDLTSIGGVPWIAWRENAGGGANIRVARLNAAGTAWEQPVGGASPINNAPNTFVGPPSLTSIGGVPHVAWDEYDGVNSEVRVSRLNAAGTAWQQVVGGPSPINSVPSANAASPSLNSVGGVPYVAFTEYDGTNSELRVSRLNAAGTSWAQTVGGASPINADPTSSAFTPSLTVINGVPYVAWIENLGANSQIHVSRLNAAGTAWEPVVGGLSPVNNSPTGHADTVSLTSNGGVPYVAWDESDGANLQIRVGRLEPELTGQSALPTDTGAVLLTRVRSYGVASPVAFEYGPEASLGARTGATNASGDLGADTVYSTVSGLTPATAHAFRAIGFDGAYTTGASPTGTFATAPQNGPGPAGTGTPGPPGPPGPSGAKGDPAFRLLVAVVNPKLRATAGKPVSVDFLSTSTASVALEVLKGRTRVARVAGRAKVGRNRLTWNGKAGKKRASAGSYALRVVATGGDGQTASDAGKLTLTRAKGRK